MNLYLDDDAVEVLLVRLLQQAGHDVQIPADVGLSGQEDPVHLIHALDEDRFLLSRNHDDFRNLHNLIRKAQGHHPGILIVRFDNDPSRDLKPAGIVRAIRKMEQAGIGFKDEFHIVNQWR